MRFDTRLGIATDGSAMMTASQLRAARALLGIDQRTLAERSRVSVPTIQRMEASDGVVRGTVDSLTKLIGALQAAGVQLIGETEISERGGRGVRLSADAPRRRATVRGEPARTKTPVAESRRDADRDRALVRRGAARFGGCRRSRAAAGRRRRRYSTARRVSCASSRSAPGSPRCRARRAA